MATAHEIQEALGRVHDLASLVNDLLVGTLQWPVEERIEDPQKITYGWTAEELKAPGLEKQLLDGEVRQVRPFRSDQPWGIFLIEFTHERVYRTALRQVLRGLVPNRRRDPKAQSWGPRAFALHLHHQGLPAVHLRPLSRRESTSRQADRLRLGARPAPSPHRLRA